MSLSRPREAGDGIASTLGPLRHAVCGILAVSALALQPSDSTLEEMPVKENYEHLFEGIEIVPDGAMKEKNEPAKTDLPDDPDCTPETCIPA